MDPDANHTADRPVAEESLSRYFQRSAAIVRQYADLIEQHYAQPILQHVSLKFKEKPIMMTFLSIFAALSLLPLLSFIGLTLFVFSSIIFLALVTATVAFVTIEIFFVAGLVLTLWLLFIVACFATVIVVSVYLTTRLGVLVTYEGPSGVADWTHETRQYLFHAKKREATEDSDESGVLVDGDSPSSKKIKVEDEIPADD